MRTEFYYPSKDQKTKIHAIKWQPDLPKEKIKAILQISHGMVEFIDRYDHFATQLNRHGILVVGSDHLGHGKSINSKDDYGYFAAKDGNRVLLNDLHTLTGLTKQDYPDTPYFLLGHSMGSFYARQYLCEYGYELTGALILGTAHHKDTVLIPGMLLCCAVASIKGWRYRCKFIDDLAFGSYDRKFHPTRTHMDWISRDRKAVDAYLADERGNFDFTLNGYFNLFKGLSRLRSKGYLMRMPKTVPTIFLSGTDDPVGHYGRGVKKVASQFKKTGMTDVTYKLYPSYRHEILNEIGKEQVYDDVIKWIKKRIRCNQ